MVHQFRDGASLTALVLLSVCSLWAQGPYTGETEDAMIKHVKNLDISSLDRSLPKVTLEFFLQYEGEGAPIKWSMENCSQLKGNPAIYHDTDSCVVADVDLKDNRSATVVVLVGKLTRARSATVPSVFRVTVTGQDGLVHDIQQLRDLPMELHRPLPRAPRDLSAPAAAA